jgi:spore germination protein KC
MNQRGIPMKHKPFLIVLLILSIICLSGCWDSAELQDLSIIAGVGIDKGGDDNENKFRTTVQIINPSQLAGGQQGGKIQASPVTTYSATGSTLTEALRKISHQAPSELFFPHIQIMLIGEEIAKEGILELFDVIERDSHIRILFPILIVRGNSAENALKVNTPLIAIPAQKVLQSLNSSEKIWGEYPSTRADQILGKLRDGSVGITGIHIKGNVEKGNSTTNVQQISQETRIEIKGLALLKDGKLEKWVDEDTARGLMWINNKMKRTIMSLDCQKKKDAVAVELARSDSNIKVKIKNEKPVIYIKVETEGALLETQCPMEIEKDKTIKELEGQLDKEIKEEIIKTINAAQEVKSDIFGFGKYINIEDKKHWKKIEKKWEDEIFPDTEFIVNVNAAIRRTGMRTKPYIK